MATLNQLLQKLWDDYSGMNKQAGGIYKLLTARQEKIVNDHIAFRTFNIPKVGIDALAKVFVDFGYRPNGEYHFKEKKLYARHFEHSDENYPKVFISELKLEECSPELQKIVKDLVAQVPDSLTKQWDFSVSGVLGVPSTPWKPLNFSAYEKLLAESEYAAWMSAFGFRANHFTVYFNALKTFKSFPEFNEFLKKSGYKLNSSGGEIKGSPQEYLEQSSTLAHPVEVQFSDGKKTIPGCYYEFAKRYPLPNGKLFTGFVAQSADKIFESTNVKKK